MENMNDLIEGALQNAIDTTANAPLSLGGAVEGVNLMEQGTASPTPPMSGGTNEGNFLESTPTDATLPSEPANSDPATP